MNDISYFSKVNTFSKNILNKPKRLCTYKDAKERLGTTDIDYFNTKIKFINNIIPNCVWSKSLLTAAGCAVLNIDAVHGRRTKDMETVLAILEERARAANTPHLVKAAYQIKSNSIYNVNNYGYYIGPSKNRSSGVIDLRTMYANHYALLQERRKIDEFVWINNYRDHVVYGQSHLIPEIHAKCIKESVHFNELSKKSGVVCVSGLVDRGFLPRKDSVNIIKKDKTIGEIKNNNLNNLVNCKYSLLSGITNNIKNIKHVKRVRVGNFLDGNVYKYIPYEEDFLKKQNRKQRNLKKKREKGEIKRASQVNPVALAYSPDVIRLMKIDQMMNDDSSIFYKTTNPVASEHIDTTEEALKKKTLKWTKEKRKAQYENGHVEIDPDAPKGNEYYDMINDIYVNDIESYAGTQLSNIKPDYADPYTRGVNKIINSFFNKYFARFSHSKQHMACCTYLCPKLELSPDELGCLIDIFDGHDYWDLEESWGKTMTRYEYIKDSVCKNYLKYNVWEFDESDEERNKDYGATWNSQAKKHICYLIKKFGTDFNIVWEVHNYIEKDIDAFLKKKKILEIEYEVYEQIIDKCDWSTRLAEKFYKLKKYVYKDGRHTKPTAMTALFGVSKMRIDMLKARDYRMGYESVYKSDCIPEWLGGRDRGRSGHTKSDKNEIVHQYDISASHLRLIQVAYEHKPYTAPTIRDRFMQEMNLSPEQKPCLKLMCLSGLWYHWNTKNWYATRKYGKHFTGYKRLQALCKEQDVDCNIDIDTAHTIASKLNEYLDSLNIGHAQMMHICRLEYQARILQIAKMQDWGYRVDGVAYDCIDTTLEQDGWMDAAKRADEMFGDVDHIFSPLEFKMKTLVDPPEKSDFEDTFDGRKMYRKCLRDWEDYYNISYSVWFFHGGWRGLFNPKEIDHNMKVKCLEKFYRES